MKLYLIGGLGADYRVFDFLELNIDTEMINWIDPDPEEDLAAYSNRLLVQVDQSEAFGLLGVSFGGIIAIEMARNSSPETLILISSVENSEQLPKPYVLLGKTGVLSWIPDALIKPPNALLGYLFGADNKKLLKDIIKDTKPDFIRWALKQILSWTGESYSINTIRIHGSHDRLIPLIGDAIVVSGGGHFMIVDRANEISALLNKEMNATK